MDLKDAVFRTSAMPIVRRVVCAANRNPFGRIVLGARHYDEQMHKQIKQMKDHGDETWYKAKIEQGFIDQFGKFMTRTEAWKVALAAGQIIYRCGGDTIDGGTLFSENLY
jgi:hypothetical protein